ncbi:unnamed protein product, partial [Meganyctiphanes norvegica]
LQPTTTTQRHTLCTMRSVFVLCLFGLALGAPRPQEEAVVLPDEVAVEAPVEAAAAPLADSPVSFQTIDAAAPVEAVINARAEGEPVAYLLQETSPVIGPVFTHRLQLDNGISETRSGSEGAAGTATLTGSYTIPLENGEVATFTWIADENGYRVESPFLSQSPTHVADQLRIAKEQRAAGIKFDGQGFRIEA